ncbi:MAG: PAS domain S-box protein [SAR324 cluster bacterium]|nr:PAS domain S-box protein [SAR324 cluster bacterium]
MQDQPEITILVIDDEEAIHEFVSASLTSKNYTTIHARNGRVGLEEFRKKHPDLLLLDLHMPEVDGFQVITAVRDASPDTPIIVISGTSTIETVIAAIRSGANDFILKPILDISLLEHVIDKALEHAALLQENERYREHLEEEIYKRTTALQESEEKFRTLVQSAPEAIILMDKNNNMVSWNQGAVNIFGYTEAEALGKSLDIIITPHDRETKLKEIHFSDNSELLGKTFELSGLRKTGVKFPLEISIAQWSVQKTIYFCGIIRDITDRKQGEEEKKRFIEAIEQITEGILITDTRGIIQYVNPAFEKITGYSSQEVLGQPPKMLKSGKHEPTFYKRMWETIQSGNVWKNRIINKTKKGRLYEEEMTISPVRNALDEITNYVAVKYDVTHQVQLEKQLQQAQKMEAIGTLAGGIAHDFNNILYAMTLGIEVTRKKIPKDTKGALKHLDQVQQAGKRAADLVKQILTFSRQKEQEFHETNITPIVKESLNLLRASLPSTIIIEKDISPKSGKIMADPTLIHQIMMNLCSNAGYAMRQKGGTLRIQLKETILSKEFTALHEAQPGQYLQLTIADTGGGIPSDIKDRVFDPFFTTKPIGEGTGMGLSMVHGIVKSHQGIITVDSTLHEGTSFHVFFPIITEEQENAQIQIPLDLPSGEGHILFVDDENMMVEIGKILLQQAGYQVTATTNSKEALSIFSAEPSKFDLVITDQTMPQMTGDQLIQRIRSIRPDIPIILTTGFIQAIDEKNIKNSGIDALLLKPIDPQALLQSIQTALKNAGPSH